MEIAEIAPDVLAIQSFDYDHDLIAMELLQARLDEAGHPMAFGFSTMSNSGRQSGFDLDRDGRLGEPEDAWGYGRFPGNGGMVLLSRYPIDHDAIKDFTPFRWMDLEGLVLPQMQGVPYFTDAEIEAMPLHPVAAWAIPITVGTVDIHVLSGQSAPPVFDGPEDRNGMRNADQARFWAQVIERKPVDGWVLPDGPWVSLGGLNADPHDGEGRSPQFLDLLNHPMVEEIRARAPDATDHDSTHIGPSDEDTAIWPSDPGPGSLRVDYILTSNDLSVRDSAVARPTGEVEGQTFRHFPVWADIVWE